MQKSHLLLACLLCCHGLSLAVADTILGVEAGVNYWQHDLADSINAELSDSNRDEKGNVFYVSLEHPVPFLPNVKLQQNNIEGDVRGNFQIIGIDGVIQNSNARSSADLSHTDIMLYYEILDNWLNLDLGFSLKQFDGHANFNLQGQNAGQRQLDDWVPMLYGKGQFDLPLTGFSVYGSVEALSLGGDEVTDVEVGLSYESKIGLGGVLGYRALNTDWENNNGLTADLQAEGFFLGLKFHF